MLISDLERMGKRLQAYRKQSGKTQAEVAEESDLSERAYASIERGKSDMRIITAVQICKSLQITLDDLLLEDQIDSYVDDLQKSLNSCSPGEIKMISQMLEIYIKHRKI